MGVLELMEKRSIGTEEGKTLERRFMTPLKKALGKLSRFNDLIEYTFDKQELENGNFYINKAFDPRLTELAQIKDSLWRFIGQHRAEVEDDLRRCGGGAGARRKASDSQEAVKVLDCSSFGFVFRVTKKDQRIIQVSKRKNVTSVSCET